MPQAATSPNPAAPARGETWTERDWADALCIWRLCGRAGCLRSQSCRSDADDCIARCLGLLPPDVQEWFEVRYECQRDGVSWQGELTPEQEEAFEAWQIAVRRSLPGAVRQRR